MRGFDTLVPKKVLGSRTECFQSLTVVLQPSHSCSITSFRGECKPSNGSPRPGVHLKMLSPWRGTKGSGSAGRGETKAVQDASTRPVR